MVPGQAWAGLLRQVPAAFWPPDPEAHRSGLNDHGRLAAGYDTKRTAQQKWLIELLLQARRGELPGMVETAVTLVDAVAEWLRYCEHDRAIKPSTLNEYRNTANRILRDLGDQRLEAVTTAMLERWAGDAAGVQPHGGQVHRDPARHLPPGDESVGAAAQSSRRGRAAALPSVG